MLTKTGYPLKVTEEKTGCCCKGKQCVGCGDFNPMDASDRVYLHDVRKLTLLATHSIDDLVTGYMKWMNKRIQYYVLSLNCFFLGGDIGCVNNIFDFKDKMDYFKSCLQETWQINFGRYFDACNNYLCSHINAFRHDSLGRVIGGQLVFCTLLLAISII